MKSAPTPEQQAPGERDRPTGLARVAASDDLVHRWLAPNEQAIDCYNAFVERNGVFSDDYRLF